MPIVEQKFDREKHVYRDSDLAELLRKAVQFFNGTPVLQLSLNPDSARNIFGEDVVDAVRDFNGLNVETLPIVDEVRTSGFYALCCQGEVHVSDEVEIANDYS